MALLFGVLSILVSAPTYLVISHIQKEQILDEQRAILQNMADAAATVIAENLVQRRREIELLAQSDTFRTAPLDGKAVHIALERLKKSYPHYSWIGLTGPEGIVRSATSNHLVGQSAAARPWFQKGRFNVFVGDVHEALLLTKLLPQTEPGQPARFIDFASPVISEDGQLRGVLAAHAHWRWAGTALKAATPRDADQTGIQLFIVNDQDRIIYPEQGAAPQSTTVNEDLLSRHGRNFLAWGRDGRFLITASAVAEPTALSTLNWRVVVRQPESILLANVARLQRAILLISILGVVVFILLAWQAASLISRPIERLTVSARRIRQGDEHARFSAPPTSSRELQELSKALEGMSNTLLEQKHALETSNQRLEIKVAHRTEELHRLNRELESLARTDALTGTPNRMAANEALLREFARFKRGHPPYAVLMMDIDYFKRINDTYGHATGDDILRSVASIIRDGIRATDFFGRVGGEEFMALLLAADQIQAESVAEKIRSIVESTGLEPVGTVTISIGACIVQTSDRNPDDALKRADEALYRAKTAGRNRVVVSNESTPPMRHRSG